jgi:hypothetical protein
MTQDEIIELAREVGMEQDGDMWFSNLYKTDMDVHISHLEAFAKLVAAKAFEEGFFAGFSASGEGFNGEYPYGDKGIDIKTDQWVLNELKEARGET